LLNNNAFAQKFAYVDTEYILDLMPEYRSAQKQLDAMSEDWQKEIEKKQSELDKAEKEFNTEQILMSDEMKKKKANGESMLAIHKWLNNDIGMKLNYSSLRVLLLEK
jgi:Skp family chaperone for outer membrane proteins